ncbi:MAG: GSCFA domain-containing protein [Bacteroidota bacterium]
MTGKIVANCHKRPQVEFEKMLLTPEEIIGSFEALRSSIKGKIVVTLSPVRHIKDTLELNLVSKSILRYAISRFNDVDYFPAYEIMMDDLRDYRFYDDDMIHPSTVAIEYIWKKFGERYFSDETKRLNERWQKVLKSINHKVFNEGTGQHKKFLEGVLTELVELSGVLDVEREISEVKKRMAYRVSIDKT